MDKRYNLPRNITLIYVFFTFFLSIIGPAKFLRYEYKWWNVLFYLIFVFILFSIGYYFGIHTKIKEAKKTNNIAGHKTKKLIFYSSVISIITSLIEIIYLIKSGYVSLNLSTIGDVYFQDISGDNIAIIIRFLSGFFRLASSSLGFYYFGKINKSSKILVVFNAALVLFISLFGYGQQKNIGDFFIYIVIAIFVNNMRKNKRVLDKKSKVLVVLIILIALFSFSYIQSQRYKVIGVTAYNYQYRSNGQIAFDTDNIIFKIFGDDLGFGLSVMLSLYLSQGYYGLSLCQQMDFRWTHFGGSSVAFSLLLDKLGYSSAFTDTYLARLSSNYIRNGYSSWNTIFPWLASDFTFFGTAIIFCFIGYFFAKTWKEVLQNNNSISYLFFSLLFILVIYIPANNQIFHSYQSFIATWTTIIFWFFFRSKYSFSGVDDMIGGQSNEQEKNRYNTRNNNN